MKRYFSILHIAVISMLILANQSSGEDYQYQYFKEEIKEYTPFSDYIPKIRLHYKTVPHYLEDFYELYCMNQHYNENSLRKNIERLKMALASKFRHPSQAFVKIESEDEYLKYRNLMFMHINILLMRNHMSIASRYDKRRVYFYNLDFAKDIRESLDTAESLYHEALPYWSEAKKYAERASDIKITTDMGTVESERYSIIHGDIDFEKIINNYLRKVEDKKKTLDDAISAKGR